MLTKKKYSKMLKEQKLFIQDALKNAEKKGRIIIAKNESVYNVNKSCRSNIHNLTLVMNYIKKLKIKNAVRASVLGKLSHPVKQMYI